MDDDARAELRTTLARMLKANRFRLVIRTNAGAYFKGPQGKYVLVTTTDDGEPKVTRLDR